MNIHTRINYRSWIIQRCLLNYFPLERIQEIKIAILRVDGLKSYASSYLSYQRTSGKRSTYFKSALRDRLDLITRKKLGVNYEGKSIGFGNGINKYKF